MLEGLDKVDWSQLSHHIYLHHGANAADVPQWIHDLLSDEEDVRESASFDLMGEGQDFGTVTDATAHFIPFLVEILAVEDAPIRWEILYFLGQVAWDGLKSADKMAKLHPSLPEYHNWQNAGQCLDIIRQFTEAYRPLLNDKHKDTRMFAQRLIHMLETGQDTL